MPSSPPPAEISVELSPVYAEQILSEAQWACFDHEDCRANLELGMACRVERAKKGR